MINAIKRIAIGVTGLALSLALGTVALLSFATVSRAQEMPAQVDRALNELPNVWFVELSGVPTVDGNDEATLNREKEGFRERAKAAGIQYSERRSYHKLWNGLTVRAERSEIDKLKNLAGVTAVYPVVKVNLDAEPGNSGTDLATAITMTGADIVQSKLGYTGRGVKVAVIDTGIDYGHPDLGGCFGPHCRVRRGWDFVGDAYDADLGTPPVPDPDPMDCAGHGTHVAGIIGAKGAVTGVAPGVTFYAYRVFGCTGSTSSDIMLEAMERALDDGADVLNMSIGSSLQWPQYPTAQGADRLVRRGMVVVASIGNSGANGLYSAGAPGVGKRVIGVASFDNIADTLPYFTISPDAAKAGFNAATGAPAPPISGSFPMARTGTAASTADACAALPAGSLAGEVALVRRGTCSFYVKAYNASAAGAVAVVLYNNTSGRISPTVAGTPAITIPVVAVSKAEGELIDSRLAAGGVDLAWTALLGKFPNTLTGGLISSFSSYGLAPDLSLKPDIGAPGGSIFSTYPLKLGGYANLSGTSMSSPHVAGAAALLLQARPWTRAEQVRDILQNSAAPAPWFGNPGLGFLDNVHRQGAGMLRVDNAILATTQVMPGKLALGEFELGPLTEKVKEISIENHGRRTVTYTLGHAPALATGANTFVPSFYAAFATVSFSQATVKVRPHEEREVKVRIAGPAVTEARLFGGYVTLTPDDGSPTLRVPYAGYNGDYQAITALTSAGYGFPWLTYLSGGYFNQVSGAWTYTMVGDDVPYILLHLDHQVRTLRMEVIDLATGESRHFALDQDYMGRSSTATGFFAFPWDGTTFRWDGGHTRAVPNGSYQIVVTALKALGNPHDPADTETWTSPTIVIARPPTP